MGKNIQNKIGQRALDISNIPKHVGVIIDGNRHWASERNLPIFNGYVQGRKKVKLATDWFFSRGVEIVSFFGFSTENWNRPKKEVNYLMELLNRTLGNDLLDQATKKGYKIVISGRIEELPGKLPQRCHEVMEKTSGNKSGIVNICLNYGGRAEIVDAIRKMAKAQIQLDRVDEELIKKYLYQGDLPDPDVIVRTSGEYRLSGFQLWQAQYSELIFLEKYWPDFEQGDVETILREYGRRQRRFGK